MSKNSKLFQEAGDGLLLEIRYAGPSFDGAMEINALAKEISAVSNCLMLTTNALARNKKISFKPKDLELFVEAFESGSFKQRIRAIVKTAEKHPITAGSIALVLAAIIQSIPQYDADEIRKLSPRLMGEIGDQVKVELLSDANFRDSLADIIEPLDVEDDEAVFTPLGAQSFSIGYEQKAHFLGIAGRIEDDTKEIQIQETLRGRITRVDLDATKNTFGFKVNDEGSAVSTSFVDKMTEEEKKNLLGGIVQIEALVTKRGSQRVFIQIKGLQSIASITQERIDL